MRIYLPYAHHCSECGSRKIGIATRVFSGCRVFRLPGIPVVGRVVHHLLLRIEGSYGGHAIDL